MGRDRTHVRKTVTGSSEGYSLAEVRGRVCLGGCERKEPATWSRRNKCKSPEAGGVGGREEDWWWAAEVRALRRTSVFRAP